MEQFLYILTRPDNLPIAGMVIALVFLLGVWWRQVRVHDRLIKEGRKDEIGDEMRR